MRSADPSHAVEPVTRTVLGRYRNGDRLPSESVPRGPTPLTCSVPGSEENREAGDRVSFHMSQTARLEPQRGLARLN